LVEAERNADEGLEAEEEPDTGAIANGRDVWSEKKLRGRIKY
jgi:hypothetical protein